MNALIEFVLAFPLVIILAIVVIIIVPKSFKIVQEYERAVVFRLGRLQGVKGPGLFLIIPFLDTVKKVVDIRIITLNVPSQEAITKDNVTIRVTAVVYFRVVDPAAVVIQIEDYWWATSNIAQTTLRDVIGQSDLDTLLSHREEINQRLQTIIDLATKAWGIKVRAVEVRDVELPASMQRAMAKQAEAEREKRATVIHASGELEASRQLAEAANIMSHSPASLQLRYLQTLTEVAVEKNSTIVFPMPLELMTALQTMATNGQHSEAAVATPKPAEEVTRREGIKNLNGPNSGAANR